MAKVVWEVANYNEQNGLGKKKKFQRIRDNDPTFEAQSHDSTQTSV